MKGRLGVRGTKGTGRTKAHREAGGWPEGLRHRRRGEACELGDLAGTAKALWQRKKRRWPRRCSQTDAHGRASGKHAADMSGAVELSRQIEMRSGCVCKDAFDCGIVERSS
ncbi:hypothetical protein ERJ75_001137700 [Trypanosoma vivax]|nr:hypothetical protein ERJ75_001137700 [Trypanosoma vivax]